MACGDVMTTAPSWSSDVWSQTAHVMPKRTIAERHVKTHHRSFDSNFAVVDTVVCIIEGHGVHPLHGVHRR
jgi:hypothetical protein